MATCFGPSLDHLQANVHKYEVQSVVGRWYKERPKHVAIVRYQ